MSLSHQNMCKWKTSMCKALPLSKGEKGCPWAPRSRKPLTPLSPKVSIPDILNGTLLCQVAVTVVFFPRYQGKKKPSILSDTAVYPDHPSIAHQLGFPGSLTDIFHLKISPHSKEWKGGNLCNLCFVFVFWFWGFFVFVFFVNEKGLIIIQSQVPY